LSSNFYILFSPLKSNGMGYFKWINCNKSIINDVGLGFIDVKYISKINLFKSSIMKLQVHQEVNSKVNLKENLV
jgi:hypothetical protein